MPFSLFQFIEAEELPIQPSKNEIPTSRLKRINQLQSTRAKRRKSNVKRRWDKDYTRDDDDDDEDACQFVEVAADGLAKNDECTIFGQMVASQIRKLTQRNQAIAKNRIQNFIFELEMEEMNTDASNKSRTTTSQE